VNGDNKVSCIGRNEIIFRSPRDSMITASKRPQVDPAVEGRGLEVFTAEALEFIADLHRRFNPTRLDLLRRRGKRQARVDQGTAPDFLKATRRIRDDSWSIAPVPVDLIDRRVEITGPPERHVRVDREDTSASLVDFGLFFFHNARELVTRGTGPYFYLPKMESHLEARLWNDVFAFAEDAVGVRRGTTKATALIETFPAA